jgi:hypothetical protein
MHWQYPLEAVPCGPAAGRAELFGRASRRHWRVAVSAMIVAPWGAVIRPSLRVCRPLLGAYRVGALVGAVAGEGATVELASATCASPHGLEPRSGGARIIIGVGFGPPPERNVFRTSNIATIRWNATIKRPGPQLPLFPPTACRLGGKLREQRSPQTLDQLAVLDGVRRYCYDAELVTCDHPVAKANLVAHHGLSAYRPHTQKMVRTLTAVKGRPVDAVSVRRAEAS